MSHKTGIDFLLEVNEKNSKEFVQQTESRWLYRKRYRTEFAALKCMDGRILLPEMTNTPLGIIQPYRNLGGKFHLGWPFFQQAIEGWKKYADSKDRDSVVLVTYHFSRGDAHRGCAGHKYDTDKAREFSLNLKKEFDFVYRSFQSQNRTRLFAIQVGIETDYESLILHGEDGRNVDLADVKDDSESNIHNLLMGLYPKIFAIAPNVIDDFVPLVRGNVLHVAEIKASGRPPQEADHKEFVLAVGRGFDWLHLPNKALIVGPWQDNLAEPIGIAASLIKKNLEAGLIDGKAVLLTSGVYREPNGPEPLLAELKARYLKNTALKVIESNFKEILPHLQILVTTVDLNTRKVNVIERVN